MLRKSAKINLILRNTNVIHNHVICNSPKNKFKNIPPAISFEIFQFMKEFSKEKWNALAGEKIFLQHNYLFALENSTPAGIRFRYVFVYENKILKAICYFQLADLTSAELGSFINLENYGGIINSVGNRLNDLLFSGKKYRSNNLLVCGSLFVSGEYGIACKDERFFPDVFKLLPEIINNISERITDENGRVVGVSIKDFYEEHDIFAIELTRKNFYRMVIDPNMIFKIRKDWTTYDDYLNAMSAKYRLRANNVMKKIEDVEIKYLEPGDIRKEKEGIEKLYHNVQKKAPVRIVKVDIHYFLELKKQLKNDFVFRAFYLEHKMIAFTSGFKHDSHYEAHFIGIDYHYNKSHLLYQNILYDFIHEAIKNKSSELVFGRTAMEIKSGVGAVAYPLFAYIKLSNSFLNKLVKPFIPTEENKSWIPRNPFRED